MSEQFEFNEEQNRIFKAVATRSIVQAVLFGIQGVISAIMQLLVISGAPLFLSIVSLFSSAVFIVMAVVFYRPADNLKRITTSQGNDITELMTAIKEYQSGFKFLGILLLINLFTLIAALIFNL